MTEENRVNVPQGEMEVAAEGVVHAENAAAVSAPVQLPERQAPQLKVPYKGDAPYIFISYAHKNGNEVYQIVAHLQQEGYRVWYDGGIDPGIEWAENIAARVSNCAYFIAFITKEYVASSNCQDELSFARDQEKPRLLVYLEDTVLPPGMSMRLNRLQAIHKYTYQNEADFYEKLYMADGIKRCLFNSGEEGSVAAVSPMQAVMQSAAANAPAGPVQPAKGQKKGIGKGLLIGGIAAAVAVVGIAAVALLAFGKKNYYDMKRFTWNMAQEDAVAAWSKEPAEQGVSSDGLKYVSYADASVAGYDASAMNLYFASDGLSLVKYWLVEGEYQAIWDDLYKQYGKPAAEMDQEAYWEIEEGCSIGVRTEEEGLCLYYQIPYVSYYDMQGFAYGMSMEEAQQAAQAAGMKPAEDPYGITSWGSPYLRYESMPLREYDAAEGGYSFLLFDAEGLSNMEYRLKDGSYQDLYDELEDYYGEPEEKNGSVVWEISEGNYILLQDGENYDRIIYRNYEDSSELEIPYWNWQGITLHKTSQEEAKALMAAAGFAQSSEGINNSGTIWQCYEGGKLEIPDRQLINTYIFFDMQGAREIRYDFEVDIYQELCELYTAFYGDPDTDNGNYIQWKVDGGSNYLIIKKNDTYTSLDYYTAGTDGYWNVQGLKIGSTSLPEAKTILANAGLTPYKEDPEGVNSSGNPYLGYQDVELMGHTAYQTFFIFDTNGFSQVRYNFKDGGYQEILDELVAYYGEPTWANERNGWNMSGGRWLLIVDSGDGYYIVCGTNASKGFYDLNGLRMGMSLEDVQAAMEQAGLTVIKEEITDTDQPRLYYGSISYAGYENCELELRFNEENALTRLIYKIPQENPPEVYNNVCNSLNELYEMHYNNESTYKYWVVKAGEAGGSLAVYVNNEGADTVNVWIY